VSFADALQLAAAGRLNADELADLAAAAMRESEEERVIGPLQDAASKLNDARLWQWTGLLQRAIDDHADALDSFAQAAALAPADASIAHGRARVALEAGIPAVDLFQAALRLAPADADVVLGLAAAQFAVGAGEKAETGLDAALNRNPRWIEGHAQLAQLRSMLGKPHRAAASIDRALGDNPGDTQLWSALFDLAIRSSDFEALASAVARARAAGQRESALIPFEAVAVSEMGETERADGLLVQMPASARASVAIWEIRHLLRSGRVAAALPLIDRELAGPGAAATWPYASIAWRVSGDERRQWLEKGDRLISVIDLTSALPQLQDLAAVLRRLHNGMGQYLDQSVRGGSQTDGPLFARIEPEIRALRGAVVDAVRSYVASLPDPDRNHPLLARRRDKPVRFSGSWSVRLREGGRHANHVHPQGWISSAFYVALPPTSAASDPFAGWLTLGEAPEELGLGLSPIERIEPREGQLVLFPSWMWHGTVPFDAGERMTAAFDVRLPN